MKNLSSIGFSNYSATVDGHVYSLKSNRFLKNYVGTDGYHRLTLINDSSEKKYVRVNRIIALAYHPDGYGEGLVVNHLDGDKLNNHYTNLEWCTNSENIIHAIDNGLQTTVGGLDLKQINTVHEVCKLLEQGYRKDEIATLLGVTTKFVYSIQSKTHYSWVSDEYDLAYVKKANKLSLAKVRAICQSLEDGLNLCQCAKKHNVGTSSVHRIRQRQSYTDISKSFIW